MVFLMAITFFFIPYIHSEAKQPKSDDIILKVGEIYDYSQDYSEDVKPVLIIGISVCYDGRYLYGILPGSSVALFYEDGNYYFKRIIVEKSGIEIIMFDVGQGDSFLVRVNDRNILIDTGEKKYYEFLLQQLDYLGIDIIDTLIISHMDTDHLGAATLVMEEYGIDEVIMPYTEGNSNEYYKLVNYLDKESVTIIYAEEGECIDLGFGCILDILGADLGEDTNSSSLVMKLSYYEISFLFTGDASASILNMIMERNDISADVLKVPHHGSDMSSPLLFLKNCGADISLISVGADNAYGHPTSNVLRRLETIGSRVYRTDFDGTVIVKGDGTRRADKAVLDVTCEKIVDWGAEERLKVENGPIIGNKNSRIYHNDSCMSLPSEKNRIFFMSSEDAETAGYRPCGICFDGNE